MTQTPPEPQPTDDVTAPWVPVDLHDDGVLYMINRQVFHPRGFALGHTPTEPDGAATLVLYGDGTTPWRYAIPDELADPTDAVDQQKLFDAFEGLLQRGRDTSAADATVAPDQP